MKRIIKIIFISVFFVTIIFGGLILLNQPNDDILNNKMDCIVAVFVLTPVLIVEIEIYSIFTYVLKKKKNKTITFLKILSLAIALLFFGFFTLSFYTTTNKIETILLVAFLVYVLLKLLLLIFEKNI
ncbi:MAG: hypothetical protein U0L55_08515 [Acutalibacteraceae bacterium]|nr:hypothetical protein [Acutalibacteraceae bacterium]